MQSTTSTTTTCSNTLEGVATLAARLLEMPIAAVYMTANLSKPQLRSSAGPVMEMDWELRELATSLRTRLDGGLPVIATPESLARRNGAVRTCVAAPISAWDGTIIGMLLVAGVQPRDVKNSVLGDLADLANLAGNEIELERRRGNSGNSVERRKTQEQLLEKTLELAKFGEDLRQLHRLSTTNYASLDDLFADHLETGRTLLGLSCGVIAQVRGRYATIRAVSGETDQVRPVMNFELGQAYCGIVCEENATIACPCADDDPRMAQRHHYGPVKHAAYIGSPIVTDGETWGVLSFSSPHSRLHAFSSHEIEIIELMAKSISRSILEGRMQAARERAEALEQDRSQVLEMVAKDQPLQVVLDQIARLVERQSESLAVAIHEVRDERLRCLAAPSMPEAFRRRMQNVPLVHGADCCLAAAFTRKTEIFEAPQTRCHNDGPWASIHEYCWQACGGTPVLSGNGELIGMLTVYWKVAVQPRHVDAELLDMAGALAAIAIEHRRLSDRLEFQAHHDLLTGLPNRSLLTRTLKQCIQSAEQDNRQLAVVFVDLDRFKQINDHLGHAAGDKVLRVTGARIEACLHPGEIGARLGGDEFVAVLMVEDQQSVKLRAREIFEALRAPFEWNGCPLSITASVGVSLYPQNGHTADALLATADVAMYRVKNNGKNDVDWFAAEHEGARLARVEMEHALRYAIDRGELILRYQPIVDIRGAGGVMLSGFEVLLGWEHPQMGSISPTQFIPIAEECGLIESIGEWVLRQACSQSVAWQRAGYANVRISVNVSALQFARPDFVDMVVRALDDAGMDGSLLELELTESAIMEEMATATPKLQRLRKLGVRLSLDDFGTGYSSLGYLRWIPVDCLKIDHSFLAGIDTSAGAFTLVQTILELAHNMGLSVVAEGVENERQLELLHGVNCDKAQGHLFGPALPADTAERLLQLRDS